MSYFGSRPETIWVANYARKGRRPSARISVRRRYETKTAASPWKNRCLPSIRQAATYLVHGLERIAIRAGREVVMPAGFKDADGRFVLLDPPQLSVTQLWIDGRQIVGDELRELVQVGLAVAAQKRAKSAACVAKLDADLRAIGGGSNAI